MDHSIRHYPSVKLIVILLFLCSVSCKDSAAKIAYSKLSGQTMGTQYNITYSGNENYQDEIDSILIALNLEVSTYIEHSLISKFNASKNGICLRQNSATEENTPGAHFLNILKVSQDIYNNSTGAFDPTIMPLVNYWGFGYKEKKAQENVDTIELNMIRSFVGMNKLSLIEEASIDCKVRLQKKEEKVELDFSAIAKGYGVDIVADFLNDKNVSNYLVEIGGELVTKGLSPSDQKWKIGINNPNENSGLNDFYTIVSLSEISMASSGNYRNFYEVDGIKYGHEINPDTGRPEQNEVLSVTVLAKRCTDADAYATAFMIMGLEASMELCAKHPEIEAYIIYGNKEGGLSSKYTEGFENYISK